MENTGNEKHGKKEILRSNGTYNRRYSDVKKDKFLEGGFYDPMDIVQVKYEMLRDSEETGGTIKNAAEDFGFSRTAYYKTKEAFEQQGMAAFFPQKTGPKQPHKLTADLQGFIDDYRANNPRAGVVEITGAILEKRGVSVSRRTVERYIYKKN